MSRRSARCTSKSTKPRRVQLNISSLDIENFLQMSLTGYTITQFRERDKLIGVDLRAPQRDRVDPSQIERLAMPSPNGTAVPLAALGHFTYGLEYGVVWERDRQPTITVQADVQHGAQGIDVTTRIDKALGGAAQRSCRSATGSKSAARSRRTPRPRLRSTRRCRCSWSRCWCS